MAVHKDFMDEIENAEGLICPKCGSQEIMILATDGGTFICEECSHIFGHTDNLFMDIYDK